MSSTYQSSRSRRRGGPLKRSYVACIPCRSRKVKCVIGTEPPCEKCEREHRDCRFDIHEKSWKHRETPKWAGKQAEKAPAPESAASADQQPLSSFISPSYTPVSPAASLNQRSSRTQIPVSSNHTTPSVRIQHVDNDRAAASPSFTDRVVSSMVTGPNDALDILFDAAYQPSGLEIPNAHHTLPSLEFLSHPIPTVKDLSHPEDEVLDLWDKCRFVRQGWFTAQEAVTYVDLFYEYFAPLSLILTESYKSHSNHRELICEEPTLCCTILMIASRYFVLPGAGGHSRSHFIHQRLWQYCELLIRRVMFGQEKHSTAKTRILGTIESFILIADWHPRSIHFPPETEGWDGLLISPAYDRCNRIQRNGEAPLIRWREDVFEPSKRSERMTWMLLGSAVNLAYELGVFAEKSSTVTLDQTAEESRSVRIRKSLYIYVTQMANRLGCSSLLPDNFISTTQLSSTALSTGNGSELYIDTWMSLARLTKVASAMFFPSPDYTKKQVLNGQYSILLEHFSSTLTEWWEESNPRIKELPDALKQFITIEHFYLKAYTNALSIQAVVEQALARGIQTIDDCRNGSLQDCLRVNDLTFIQNVLSAGRIVLNTGAELASKGILRYVPLRVTTYITCSSVLFLKAVFLCRAAQISTEESSSEDHLWVLDRAVAALRSSPIDDMDFSSRYATLIEKQLVKLHACPASKNSSNQPEGNSGDSERLESQLQSTQTLDYPLLGHDTSGTGAEGFQTTTTEHYGATLADDSWWTLPFDPSLAPFTSNYPHFTLGFEVDSLDFLWNLTDIGGTG